MFEFLPLIAFLAAFLWKDIFFAMIVLMIAMPIGLLGKYLMTKKVDKMFLWSTVLLYPFGAVSIYFRDAEYLFWKPTVFYCLLAIAIAASAWIGEKPMVRRLLDASGELPTEQISDSEWRRVSLLWAAFFVAMSFVNLYVAFNFSLDFWVKFKVFGLMGITMVFFATQVFWLASKMNFPDEESSEDAD